LVGVIAYGDNWIDQLYVLPDFQGVGIVSLLLGCAKEEMDEIRLWTFQRARVPWSFAVGIDQYQIRFEIDHFGAGRYRHRQ
ncbi:hypothetical protein ACC763_40695, partial [Rhizobium ruizarguesonis]